MSARTSDRQIAAFYAAHHAELARAVARRVNATPATLEDAIQTAWVALLRRPDVRLDHEGLRWLTTVAIREGWRLASTARELPAGAFHPTVAGEERDAGVLPEPESQSPDPAEWAAAREEHARRVAALGDLKPRERRELYLQALGYDYQEIVELSGAACVAAGC